MPPISIPADLGQHVQGVLRIGPVQRQCLFHDGDLRGQLAVVDAGAAARQVGDRQSGQGGSDGGGRRRIGDAHVARAENVGAVGQFLDDLDARLEAAHRMLAAHRRPGSDIGRSQGDFLVDDLAGLRQAAEVAGNAHVDHHDAGPANRAKALMPAMPPTNPRTICAVTSCGYLLTPSAATPWSPAIVTMLFRAVGGFIERVMPARSTARSINRPKAQCGMMSWSSRCLALAPGAVLGGNTSQGSVRAGS